MINFFKYQGTGNDFILIDNRSGKFTHNKIEFAKKWCDRRFGIGSDGLIFIENSAQTDFLMDFYNPDGSQSFCGNGSRCAVRFALKIGAVSKSEISFEAIDGVHSAKLIDHDISILMKEVNEVKLIDQDLFIHTGSPHYISFDETEQKNIIEFGRKIRYAQEYKPGGTNVNLVKTISGNHIQVKTYERGVEDETFSCGTGVTACALAYAEKNKLKSGSVTTDVRGGRLSVKFESYANGYRNIWLTGPAEYVFEGIIHDSAL